MSDFFTALAAAFFVPFLVMMVYHILPKKDLENDETR